MVSDAMSETIVALGTILVVMGVADALWLSTMTERFYRPRLPGLLLDQPRWGPAIAFYLLYAAGTMVLVVAPALDGDHELARVGGTGALLGIVAYGTYDLTNLATVRGWSTQVAALDMVWGGALTAVASTLAVLSARTFA